jgi:hypothetical protein
VVGMFFLVEDKQSLRKALSARVRSEHEMNRDIV